MASGQGVGACEDPGDRPVRDDLAAVHARPGAEVDDVLGAANGLLVVLDHHHRVALCAERAQRIEQHRVVARVQSDGRLVEDVAHPAQVRSELRGESDALRLAAREGGRGTVEPQVPEAEAAEEIEPRPELRQHITRDCRLAFSRLDPRQGLARRLDVEGAEVGDAVGPVAHRERFGTQPPAGAGTALARRLVRVSPTNGPPLPSRSRRSRAARARCRSTTGTTRAGSCRRRAWGRARRSCSRSPGHARSVE